MPPPNITPLPDAQQKSLLVTPPETGLKLLRFLERRLTKQHSPTELHKWIRTGQVRVNQKRSKPFLELQEGDKIRIPPFAQARTVTEMEPQETGETGSDHQSKVQALSTHWPQILPLVGETAHFFIVNKPTDLATQPGSKQKQSVVTLLKQAFSNAPYIPAPIHRLDKATSGLLVIARNHKAASTGSSAFSHHIGPQSFYKEYLAVTCGPTPFMQPTLCLDTLTPTITEKGKGNMVCAAPGITLPLTQFPGISDVSHFFVGSQPHGATFSTGHCNQEEDALAEQETEKLYARTLAENPTVNAILAVQQIAETAIPFAATTPRTRKKSLALLRIRLFTGAKHQIRVQLAARTLPVLGDRRYRGLPHPRLLLHAFRIITPTGEEACCPPDFLTLFSSPNFS